MLWNNIHLQLHPLSQQPHNLHPVHVSVFFGITVLLVLESNLASAVACGGEGAMVGRDMGRWHPPHHCQPRQPTHRVGEYINNPFRKE